MIPSLAIRGLLGVSVATAGYIAKEQVAKRYELENPALLVTLPMSIVRHNLLPTSEYSQFHCPLRQKLHEKCADISEFDKKTVPPVNIALDKEKVPLTREAYKALKQDMAHTRQMSSEDPLHKKIDDYRQQATNQRSISSAFHSAGEREGALMHSMLATGFDLKAGIADYAFQTVKAATRIIE